MKISFSTVDSNLKTNNGYGYASYHIRNSLKNLGHSVDFKNPAAKMQIDFCQPDLYQHFNGQYKIGYTPWESSSLPEGWLKRFNSVDEVWTTSEKCKEWYEEAGVKKKVRVYEHGVESIWTPKKRTARKKLKFLHLGEPAPRKGGQMTFEAFNQAFGARDDVHLTIKVYGHSTIRAYASMVDRGGPRSILGLPHEVYQNVSLIEDDLSTEELVELYHSHDVLVYPSWGEGFGLIPLQALATGMPTICTGAWAPYERFLGGLSLNAQEHPSPWPEMHPGIMYKPDIHHLIELYKNCYDNFSFLSQKYFEQAENVHSEYNWDGLTKKAFSHLEKKF
jgi:glycosyltransferase involved in cell wall biosynthesis